jgi:multimeric flavodoxin WrbA
MKIVVLNGSPKGELSVTRKYVEWIAKKRPEHAFEILDVAAHVHGLERDAARWAEVVEKVRTADAVLWAFPLYFLLVSSQYKRFIELIAERGAGEAFRGKPTAAFSTSINFFDSAAHDWLHGVLDDLGMRYAGFYSANMHDLMVPRECERLLAFSDDFLFSIAGAPALPRLHQPLAYAPAPLPGPVAGARAPTCGKRVVVVTDARPGQERLTAMIDRFRSAFDGPTELFNLHDVDIKGGCLGCLQCGFDNRCAYTGKDGFIEFYNGLRSADILVFAGSIVARQLSWKWRQFFDRSFFNTHTPSLIGKQIAFLVSGPMSGLPEMRSSYQAWMEIQGSNLAGFLSDEACATTDLGAALDSLAARLVRHAETGYLRPRTFLGIGGMKIFRDDIWGSLRFVFRADHKAYRRLGYYDFPQRRWGRRIMTTAASVVTALPPIRSRFPGMIKREMLRPFEKAVRSA